MGIECIRSLNNEESYRQITRSAGRPYGTTKAPCNGSFTAMFGAFFVFQLFRDRKDDNFLDIRSLTPQQATGNALAYAVQILLKKDPFMEAQTLNVAIVGGGPGCKAIMDMMFAERLSQLRMNLIGVACTNPTAVGYRYAQEKGIYTTTDYRDLYDLENLGMIIELTGREAVANEIARAKPAHVRLMDHVSARLFWDIFQIEEQRLKERRRAQEEVTRSETRYRELYQGSQDGYAMVNMEGKIIEINSTFQEMLGYPEEEISEKTYEDITPEKWHSIEVDILKDQVLKRGFSDVYQKEYRRKDGTVFPIEMRTHLFKDQMGNAIGMWAWVRDITDRKRAEEALQDSEERFRLLSENIPVAVYSALPDEHCSYLFISGRMEELTGHSEREFLEDPTLFTEVIHPEDRAYVWERIEEHRQKKTSLDIQYRIITKDKVVKWVRNKATPVFDEKGEIVCIDGFMEDITERKRAEEELLRITEAVESASDAIGMSDPQGRHVYQNQAFTDLFEYATARELESMGGPSAVYVDPAVAQQVFAEIMTGGSWTGEVEMTSKSGRRFTVFLRADAIRDDEGNIIGLVGVHTDITERKQAEEAMVRAKEDWENTFDAITDMVMLLDSEHRVIRVNKAAAEALNTTKESLVGRKCYEAVHRQNHPITKCPLLDTMKTLEPHTVEITDVHLGGTFICTTSPLVDHEGKLRGYTHSLKDVTESKRLEAQFQQAQKLEAVGTLAGGIAHDFNNLLMAIQGRTSLMLMHVGPEDSHFGYLRGIEDAVKRGAYLSKQLLGFARGGKYEVRATDLNRLLEKSSEMFGRTKKEIRIHKKYQKDIWPVEADQGQIEQVLMNLYVNAWQAMPAGGDLYLETRNVTLDRQYTKPFKVEPGNFVKISLTDTGAGMDEATRLRVFEPFFTTKEMGGGTGLGLASAYGIIKNHGGIISLYSEPGHGTTFDIYLPASGEEVPMEQETSQEIFKGTETVLFVDDEDSILEVGKEMLTALGYKVIEAMGGEKALELYRENQDKIDMVILDMIMPDMGGGEVYDRLKEINAKVRVLLSSGYSLDGQANHILQRGCDGFIQKPFDVRELSSKLRQVLENP
jgi:two-component system cell cycle sensor histidine kinase/response regulator CckA